jgi:hypothetical protein
VHLERNGVKDYFSTERRISRRLPLDAGDASCRSSVSACLRGRRSAQIPLADKPEPRGPDRAILDVPAELAGLVARLLAGATAAGGERRGGPLCSQSLPDSCSVVGVHHVAVIQDDSSDVVVPMTQLCRGGDVLD